MAERTLRFDRDIVSALGIAAWVAIGLYLDTGATIEMQRLIGASTWAILFALLAREDTGVRWQVAAAVLIATIGEITLSIALELYTYRLENVPSFVPPGHGIVYLAALQLARSPLVQRAQRSVRWYTLGLAVAWAIANLGLTGHDSFGAVLALCFAGFVVAGRAPLVYAACFLMASYLELIGTALGTWTWTPSASVFTLANPPSGIAGGYCLLDCAALSLGLWLSRLRAESRASRRLALR